jgi:coenzyme F420-reducing hydrogenase beta subunit
VKRFIESIWTKSWSPEEIDKFVGSYKKVYFSYAADERFRARAASGGSVTALLAQLLEQGVIDGALVLGTEVQDNQVTPKFLIAQTEEQLLSAQGSKYSAVHFTQDAFPLIEEFSGRLAVVALPCDAKILHHFRARHPEFDRKIHIVIALLCGHNSEPELTDHIVRKLVPDEHDLERYTYRFGHWRGLLKAELEGQQEVVKPFSFFSDYQNLYFFSQRKCHHCFDHMGYYCDISAGDIWSYRMKQHPIKHTALITRSESGQRAVESALNSGALVGQEEPIEEVMDGQARTLPFHYNVSARTKVGRLFGERIQDHVQERVRWNDYIVAFIALFNERLSRSRWGQRLIMMIPRPLIKLYLYFMKGLESL